MEFTVWKNPRPKWQEYNNPYLLKLTTYSYHHQYHFYTVVYYQIKIVMIIKKFIKQMFINLLRSIGIQKKKKKILPSLYCTTVYIYSHAVVSRLCRNHSAFLIKIYNGFFKRKKNGTKANIWNVVRFCQSYCHWTNTSGVSDVFSVYFHTGEDAAHTNTHTRERTHTPSSSSYSLSQWPCCWEFPLAYAVHSQLLCHFWGAHCPSLHACEREACSTREISCCVKTSSCQTQTRWWKCKLTARKSKLKCLRGKLFQEGK